jgi:hypothetical protein
LTLAPTFPTLVLGQVLLHTKFVGGVGFDAATKFLYVLGETSDNYTHFFIISTRDYSNTNLARETILIPLGTCNGLPKKCWIQCFHKVESIPTLDVRSGLHFGHILPKGKLPIQFSQSVRDVVSRSFVLQQREMDEVLTLIP